MMHGKKNRLLIAEPAGGLCNRLICINNAIHLYKTMPDLCICIVWWKEPECGCRYEDILKPISGIPIRNFSRPLESRKDLIKKKKYTALVKSYFQKCFWNYYYRNRNRNRIGSFWENGGCTTEKKLISKIQAFRIGSKIFYRMGVEYRTECVLTEDFFSEVVIEKLCKIKKMFNNKKYVGLHIRRTDHKKATKSSPMKFFRDAIERELSISKEIYFYLATDDPKVEEELYEYYGKCILFNRDGKKERITAKAIQDAAVDLLMLANAERIYGSIGSTFSEMAAQIGKKPLILRIEK